MFFTIFFLTSVFLEKGLCHIAVFWLLWIRFPLDSAGIHYGRFLNEAAQHEEQAQSGRVTEDTEAQCHTTRPHHEVSDEIQHIF